jgi:hypothetical protein
MNHKLRIVKMKKFREELEEYAQSLGMDLFGVADLTDNQVHNFILRQGGDHISSFPRSISLGIRLIDQLLISFTVMRTPQLFTAIEDCTIQLMQT